MNFITKKLDEWGIDINLCRDQIYDGAANMAGCISGLQKRVKDKSSTAVFVHCATGNLNLVLSDACTSE